MLDIKFIRENQEAVKQAVKDKGFELDLDELLQVDERRRKLQVQIDELRQKRKAASQARSQEEGKTLKSRVSILEKELQSVEAIFTELMLLVPNLPSADTPVGGVGDYKVVAEWEKPPKFDFQMKDHLALGKALDILDLERGVKVAGFRGYFLKNEGVLLQLGVLTLALRKLIEKGFTPMVPPTLVREFALLGSGHFPFGREEIYQLEEYAPDFSGTRDKGRGREWKFLAGTAEPALLAYHADEILAEKDLPVKLAGISPCYRREVGGYGKDTKGVFRVHEFMKVEQVVICRNDLQESEKWFQEMNGMATDLLKDLGLPYRVIQIATEDMGAGKYKMYDIETWMPGRQVYGETHSNSNLTDWQARRLNLRYRDRAGKINFVHTLNNTMIASPRILIALLENHQQADGSVRVPKILQDFVGQEKLSPK